jgi:hypothetical protein
LLPRRDEFQHRMSCPPVYAFEDRQLVLWTLVPYIAQAAAYLAPSIATTHRLVGSLARP